MLIVVTYDIDMCSGKQDARRLRTVSRFCEKYGVRVQNSVFEMNFDNTQFRDFKNTLDSKIDRARDSVRYYILGNSPDNRVETTGASVVPDVMGALVF